MSQHIPIQHILNQSNSATRYQHRAILDQLKYKSKREESHTQQHDNSWLNQNQYKQYVFQYYCQNKIKAQGLINLGNSCYLNTAIQFLYSSQKLRKILIKNFIKKKHQNLEILNIIALIFESIQKCQKPQARRALQRKLLLQLNKKQKNYKFYKQNDAAIAVLDLLQIITSKVQTLKELFEVRYKQYCNCDCDIYTGIFISYSEPYCQQCRQQIKIKLLNTPDYLILDVRQRSDSFKMTKEQLKLKFQNPNKQSYQCCFNFICKTYHKSFEYFGGHYYASRKSEINNKWYFFNDKSVYQFQLQNQIKADLCLLERKKTDYLQKILYQKKIPIFSDFDYLYKIRQFREKQSNQKKDNKKLQNRVSMKSQPKSNYKILSYFRICQ